MFVPAAMTSRNAAGSALASAAGPRMATHTSASSTKFMTKPTLTSIWASRRPYSSA
jgi:hypothetical protein